MQKFIIYITLSPKGMFYEGSDSHVIKYCDIFYHVYKVCLIMSERWCKVVYNIQPDIYKFVLVEYNRKKLWSLWW